MAFKRLIQCPACRFTNRFGDARCLICKEPLSQDEGDVLKGPKAAPPAEDGPAASGPAGRDTVPMKKPGASGQGARPDARATAPRKVHPEATPPVGVGRPPSDERPGRPSSRFMYAPIDVDRKKVLAWLCCDPLPPIPLGTKPVLTIGRQADCDLVLPHKEVSRVHALVKVRGQSLVFEDEGSSNGSFLNGTRVSHGALKVGDVLALGPYEVVLRSTEEMERGSGPPGETSTNLELTSVNRLNPSAGLTGKLQEVPLTELLQGIEFNKKTGTLTIDSENKKGTIVVAEGAPLFARFDALRDEEAVLRMLGLTRGRFSFSGQQEPGARTMRTTITGLLLEASRRADEHGTAHLGPDDPEATAPRPGERAALDATDVPDGSAAPASSPADAAPATNEGEPRAAPGPPEGIPADGWSDA